MLIFEKCPYRGQEGETCGKVGSPFYTASVWGVWWYFFFFFHWAHKLWSCSWPLYQNLFKYAICILPGTWSIYFPMQREGCHQHNWCPQEAARFLPKSPQGKHTGVLTGSICSCHRNWQQAEAWAQDSGDGSLSPGTTAHTFCDPEKSHTLSEPWLLHLDNILLNSKSKRLTCVNLCTCQRSNIYLLNKDKGGWGWCGKTSCI